MIRLTHPDLEPLDLDSLTGGFVCEELDLGSPAVRTVAVDRSRADGTTDDTAHFGARAVTVRLAVFDDADYTRRQNLDRLASYCHPGIRPTLTFVDADSGPRRVTLRADQFTAPLSHPDMTRVQVSWAVPSGVIESADQRLKATGASGGEAEGWSPPLEPPLAFPAHTSSPLLVTSAGSIPAAWEAAIFGPITSPAILNRTTGEVVASFPGLGIGPGDYLAVRQAERTAWLNDEPGASRYHFLDFTSSTWAPLGPGGQLIELVGESHAPPASLWIAWRDTYLI